MINLKFPTYLVKIIHHYLGNRTFYVKINSTSSSDRYIASGTLQGSIISPESSTISVLMTPSNTPLSVCIFSEDTAILCNSITTDQAFRTSQAYLTQLEIWLTKWRIVIKTNKTNAIVFRKRRSQIIPPTLKLINNEITWRLMRPNISIPSSMTT
ncbi:RNA-directed DNA polymerase from mobile element jockey [Trichonephila clavipes]|nr:RNA-directed DNA polymerase from mobile element jockey [Trichonephila clavipes]